VILLKVMAELTIKQKFLHFMTLRTGTSLILLTHLVNKVTAVYGILALFTSYPLSGLQLSMYIYSLPVLLATLYLAGPVRAQSAWDCLAFAYLYALDTLVNAVYTVFFAVTWFLVLATNDATAPSGSGPGSKMMEHTSGFTSPEFNVSHVEVVAQPKSGASPGQDALAVGKPGTQPGSGGIAGIVLSGSSMMSIFIISAFWLLRVYAICVVLAYARQAVRHQVQVTGMSTYNYGNGSPKANGEVDAESGKRANSDFAEDPFAQGTPGGTGVKGTMGRIMVSIGRSYWLGRDPVPYEQGTFVLKDYNSPNSGQGKFRKSEDAVGVAERERRRRSGTGPPLPGA
jgi:inositol phosphorylceramide synthase regulatory subunit